MPYTKGSPKTPILSTIDPFLRLILISLRFIRIISSHLSLNLPRGLVPVDLPVKILKTLLLSFVLTTCPVHLNLVDLITLTNKMNGTNY